MHVFPAKLLLFGEYTVLLSAEALAVPYHRFSGRWTFLSSRQKRSSPLELFADYLADMALPLDVEKFAGDVVAGLVFDSDIKPGYGMGSSGALCAAVWARYGAGEHPLTALREIFVEMESFFHGKSSGIDPLISYYDRPVLQDATGPRLLSPMPLPEALHVYDSGRPRRTAEGVAWFRRQLEDKTFRDAVERELIPANRAAIAAFVKGDREAMETAMAAISRWQWTYFRPLIPESLHEAWRNGLDTGRFFKLCGAGGGGYFLYWEAY